MSKASDLSGIKTPVLVGWLRDYGRTANGRVKARVQRELARRAEYAHACWLHFEDLKRDRASQADIDSAHARWQRAADAVTRAR